ncbi:MAG TPA: pitrilysin family protein [Blastocatellia bacterium]
MNRVISILTLIVLLCLSAPARAQEWKAPTAMKKLSNGLTVVVSEDHSAPTFGLCISYGIGFRLEPRGRTGFAHLFEHMMFEGTPNAPKGTFDRVIEGGGGFNNGDTRFDFTEYVESGPIASLEPVLWLEADRLKTLDFSVKNLENQRNVVEEEVRVNVLNQPYGSFYWLDLPQKAFDRYPNAHNFYGDFKDLDAANISDVQKFYEQYYAPNNAVLAIVGDVNTADVFAKVEKYFAAIQSRPTPARPDVNEAPQTKERRITETDKLATIPALGIAYRMPPRSSPDAIVGAVTAELLHDGDASILYQSLVKDKQVASVAVGGMNWPLGDPLEYNGPTLMTSFIVYPPNVTEDQLLSAYDATIAGLARTGPTREQVGRVAAKMRSDWYGRLELPLSRAGALSHAVLFEGNFDSVYQLPDRLARVTPEEIRAFTAKYLVPSNRTIINRVPAPPDKASRTAGGEK